MEPIIAPVDKELIKAEQTPDRFMRDTRKGGNKIYIIDCNNAPNVMREIGRLREIAFRYPGGGTGLPLDIDEFDTMDPPCQQLIVWNPDAEEIIGGYRFIVGENIRNDEMVRPRIATSHLFEFSQKFLQDYLPHTIELGRSFVTLEYQSSRAGAKGLFALDNLWDGLGALTVDYPQIEYFFGKVTMYPTFSQEGRNMILYFLNKHFPDPDRLVWPKHPLQTDTDEEKMSKLFIYDDFKEDYKILNQEVRKLGYNIPPLVTAYMGLSPTMKMFGTAINDEFGNVEESGIIIAIKDIIAEKRSRYIETYDKLPPIKIS